MMLRGHEVVAAGKLKDSGLSTMAGNAAILSLFERKK
jgi:hypothetical protein